MSIKKCCNNTIPTAFHETRLHVLDKPLNLIHLWGIKTSQSTFMNSVFCWHWKRWQDAAVIKLSRGDCDINSSSCLTEAEHFPQCWERRGAAASDAWRVSDTNTLWEVWKTFMPDMLLVKTLFVSAASTLISRVRRQWQTVVTFDKSLPTARLRGLSVFGTHQGLVPVCSWVSGCCGCAGTAPSAGGPSRRSGWGAMLVYSGSKTLLRSLLCGKPAWDSWHSLRRWRQTWEENTIESEKRQSHVTPTQRRLSKPDSTQSENQKNSRVFTSMFPTLF